MSTRSIAIRSIWAAFAAFTAGAAVAAASAQAPFRSDSAPPTQLLTLVEFRDEKQQERSMAGRIVVAAADGGLLLQGDDGALWTIEANQITRRTPTEKPFAPLGRDELVARIVAEMPAGFSTHVTDHYIVVYDTSRAFAQWTASLLERLHKAFTGYWQREGLAIREPEFPLVVMVFAERDAYAAASRIDLPGGVGSIVGFYSLRSNRINMFDLTGTEAFRVQDRRRATMRDINQVLSQPAAIPMVATIVHEATHQIAFNCGLSARYADIPLWLCEGMAVYFEAPDLTSSRGWAGIGKVNYPRLETFRKNLSMWNDESLSRLVVDDRRFRDSRGAADAYADAWALNYYLIRHEPQAYAAYLKAMAEKRPLAEDGPQARLEEFRRHFGDMKKLEQDFLRQMSRVK